MALHFVICLCSLKLKKWFYKMGEGLRLLHNYRNKFPLVYLVLKKNVI